MSRRILCIELPDNSAPAGTDQIVVDRVVVRAHRSPEYGTGGSVTVAGQQYFWSIREQTAVEARQREIRETQAEADIKADRGE